MSPAASLLARVARTAVRLRRSWAEAATADALLRLDARTRHDLGLPPVVPHPAHRFYL